MSQMSVRAISFLHNASFFVIFIDPYPIPLKSKNSFLVFSEVENAVHNLK